MKQRLKHRIADIVIFGGTGDLALRKLFPALYEMERTGRFDDETRIFGASRSEHSDEEFRSKLEEAGKKFIPKGEFEADIWTKFASRISYVQVSAGDEAGFKVLYDKLSDQPDRDRVYYFSTSPSLFADMAFNLKKVGLVTPNSRVVLEKPLGHDLESCREINGQIGEVFEENQIFRIDHYLGKETVQNLMILRFANAMFEPLWNSAHIDHVQITVGEEVGVEGRWSYYDDAGAMRDMVQNHMLQLLCLVAMEAPYVLDQDAVRDEKVKVLKALQPITDANIDSATVRGQYRKGAVGGKEVPGYLEEEGANVDSTTETFVAIRAELNNWRWAGVPFYLRTGKRLPKRHSEIVIQFRDVPHQIFPLAKSMTNYQANKLVLRLQPDDGIHLVLNNKNPGPGLVRLRPTALNLSFAEAFGGRSPDAYERLLLDAIDGNNTLFVRRDEQDIAWQWVDAIQEAWQNNHVTPKGYTSGTWGPSAAIALIERDGRTWNEEAGF
ncbi:MULTISPECIES: glucose-6-phosphate dehydrogenase [Thalassospira]|jgi:glucose-6-phosphate 1-dehydrogenase|uniref:Glucose-6-phosphate 1-dehydrogenase n=2 Tax=Thalassospira TaxID=168934 RepID=A0A367VZP0_9PROT|nr:MULTISPECIES: glucose-6-phosphate dehydrogenase [Thalassospira]MDG4720312.1 glucose-6-phosphate dehydrogenase [Thalassospira sp. FZY0004]RCK32194.1 glucose-6-phosphate dehydrogenase [Thalassospira profundimaris]